MSCNFQITETCRVCMCTATGMYNIFAEQQSVESNTLAAMLSECIRYKVTSNDTLPQQICGKCALSVRQAFEFKHQAEESYRILSQLDCLDAKENKVPVFGIDQYTQTEDSTFYPCEHCGENYFSFIALKTHREQAHRGSSIVCRFCTKTFNRVGYLKTHMAVFHPEKGYTSHNQCQICQRSFTRREHMRRHMAVIHKELEIVQETEHQRESITERTEQVSNALLEIVEEKPHVTNILLVKKGNEMKDEQQHEVMNIVDYGGNALTTDSEDETPLAELRTESSTTIETSPNKAFAEVFLEVVPSVEAQTDCVDALVVECNEDPPKSPNSSESPNACPLQKRGRGRPRRRDKSQSNQSNHNEGIQSNKDEYKCTYCEKIYSIDQTLQEHSLKRRGLHICEICRNELQSVTQLKENRRTADPDGTTNKCQECDKVFKNCSHFRRHWETKHCGKTHTCAICNKQFSTLLYLQRHLSIHDKKRYLCKECSASYLTKEELHAHIKAEGHDRPLLCPECGLRCKTSNILTVHMRRHNGEKPFKCKYCGKGFPRTDDLRVHEKYHTGEKSHFCNVCGKGFQRKYNLTIHLRVHTGERPYKCPHCPQAFAQGNDLKAHIRRHTGERFRCDMCDAAFVQGYQIRQHKLTEHGIKDVPITQRVKKITSNDTQKHQNMENLDIVAGLLSYC